MSYGNYGRQYGKVAPSFHLLHVGFHNFEMTDTIITALANTFGAASQWMRYAPNCWVLWTDLSVEEWHKRLERTPGLPTNYGALILVVLDGNENRSGKTFDWAWNWLRDKR